MISIKKTTIYDQIKLILTALVILLLLFVHTSSFARDRQPHMTIGIIGHDQEELTNAILKTQSKKNLASFREDRNPFFEEHERRNTTDNNFFEFKTDKRHYTLIQTPRDYTHNMISGAAQMDAAILVVSAEDGPILQTREQILIARQAGISHLVVFLNTTPETDDFIVEISSYLVMDLLDELGYPGWDMPIIVGSSADALAGDDSDLGVPAVTKLIETIDETPIPRRALGKPFLLPIDNIFDISGRGTVVTGRIEQGTINVGDEVEIVGLSETKTSTVMGLEIFKKRLERAEAGDLVGVLLRGIEPEDIKRGQVLSLPLSIKSHTQFEAEFSLLTQEEGGRHTPFFSGYSPHFYFRTADVTGVIELPRDIDMVMPGDTVTLSVKLGKSLTIEEDLGFTVRDDDRIIGTGVIKKIIK